MKAGSQKRKRPCDFEGDSPQIVLRPILLNTLTQRLVPVERFVASAIREFGFTREDVLAAARWWNCEDEMHEGEVCWRKPALLVAARKWNYQVMA
jgi:hypothetical protein